MVRFSTLRGVIVTMAVILWAHMPPAVMAAVTFTAVTGTGNPLNVDVGSNAAPTFIDIDNDGDFDAFIGAADGTIKFYQNTDTSAGHNSPVFVARTGSANPFNGVDIGSNSAPAFADVDGDGDFDALIGTMTGTIKFYENIDATLDHSAPEFIQLAEFNPLADVSVQGGYSTPAFVDIDGDGDLDCFIGSGSGAIEFWEDVGAAFNDSTGVFSGNLDDPSLGSLPTSRSAAAFLDIDDDGDFEAFSGEEAGTLRYYINFDISHGSNPNFIERTADLNPLNGVDVGSNSMPVFIDIDGDGDLDAFIGAADGTIKFYRNDAAYSLTVSKAGNGSGTVTSSPAGINCGTTCTDTFSGTVTLTAEAATGSTFAGWSGGGCSGTGTCEVTLESDTTVTATFSKIIMANWQSAAQSAAEDAGQVTVTAVLTDNDGQSLTATASVTVPFTVSGTATGGGTDHNLANGSISIAVGQSAGNTTFTVTNDELKEAAETVIVTMGTPTNATAGSVVVHTVTIVDNDYGDLNLDEKVDLADAILALQVLTGQTPAEAVSTAGDIDGNGRIGSGDVIFILERVDGLR